MANRISSGRTRGVGRARTERDAEQNAHGADAVSELDLLLPHEHDETGGEQASEDEAPQRRSRIKQAASDVRRGLKDSERRGPPSDLPGAQFDAARSPGAELTGGSEAARQGPRSRRKAFRS